MQKFNKANLGLYLFILICFALPFIKLTCNEEKVASFSGYELAVGTTVTNNSMFGNRKINAEPIATIILIVSVIGVIVAASMFMNDKKIVNQIHGTIGLIGALLLYLLSNKLESDITQQGSGVKLKFELGYYLTLLSFLSIIITNAIPIFYKSSPVTVMKKCKTCGAELKEDAKFCIQCGKEFA